MAASDCLEFSIMYAALLLSNIVLWVLVLGIGFLLLGALRALGILTWRLDQIEALRPARLGREGLKIGRPALDFTLPAAGGGQRSLSEFAGRKLLLVLTQSGCGPCMEIVPELNRLHERGEHEVLVVNNGDMAETAQWASQTGARFPVLSQDKFSLSKRYQVFVTPFAFLIDERGIITSKGIAGNREYLGYVLSGAENRHDEQHGPAESQTTDESEREVFLPSSEVAHA